MSPCMACGSCGCKRAMTALIFRAGCAGSTRLKPAPDVLCWTAGNPTFSTATTGSPPRPGSPWRKPPAGRLSPRSTLRKRGCGTAGSRSVRFAGHLAEAELAALLGAADVALVPSSYEPFGMVALEAGAAGTPVVAGAAGGLPEVVANGRTGLLVPPRDPEALAAAAVAVLRDPALASRLVLAAQRDIEARFVWPVAARAIEKVYTEAIADARPPHRRPKPVGLGNVFTGEPVGS